MFNVDEHSRKRDAGDGSEVSRGEARARCSRRVGRALQVVDASMEAGADEASAENLEWSEVANDTQPTWEEEAYAEESELLDVDADNF